MAHQKSIFWSLTSRGVSYLFILLQGIIIARLLGPEGKGIQAKLLASASFFVFFLDFGISNSINYFYSRKIINFTLTQKLLKFICFFQLIISIFIFLLFEVEPLKNFLLPNHHSDNFFVWFIVITVFLETSRLSINSFLMALLKFKLLNWIEILISLFKLICYLILYFFIESESALYTILSIDLLGNLLAFLSIFMFSFKSKNPQSNIDEEPGVKNYGLLFHDMWKYALPLFGSNLIIYFNTRLDYLAIERMQGLESLGYYAVASSGAQMLTIFPVIIGSVIFSYLNKLQDEHKTEFFAFYSRLNFTLLFFISLLAMISAPYLIPALFGKKFDNSISLFQMLIVIALLQSYKYLLGIFLQSSKLNSLRLRSDIFALLINIILLYPALKIYGLKGAIALLFIGQIFSILFIHRHLRKTHFKNSRLFFIRRAELRNLFNIDKFTELR